MRKLALASMLATALCLPSTGLALGLGEIELRSALNQRLDARIPLRGVPEGQADDVSVELASEKAFQEVGLQRPYTLTKLRFLVRQNDQGEDYVRVQSTEPIAEPFLTFLVEVKWPGGNLLREYTVLLDPPAFASQEDAGSTQTESTKAADPGDESEAGVPGEIERSAEGGGQQEQRQNEAEGKQDGQTAQGDEQVARGGEQSAAAASGTADETPVFLQVEREQEADERVRQKQEQAADDAAAAERQAAREGDRSTAEQAQASTQAQTSAEDEYGPVQKGQALWNIAKRLKSGDVTIQQMMVALLRYNPEAFAGDNVNRLRQGYVLRVPEINKVRQISMQKAVAQVGEQNAMWKEWRRAQTGGGTRKAAETKTADKASSKQGQSGTASGGEGEGQLEIVGSEEGGASSDEEASATSAGDKSTSEKLKLAKEELESVRMEKKELASRVSELEKTVKKMEKLITLREEKLSKLQQQLERLREGKGADGDQQTQVAEAETGADEGQETAEADTGEQAQDGQEASDAGEATGEQDTGETETAEATGEADGADSETTKTAGEETSGEEEAGETKTAKADTGDEASEEASAEESASEEEADDQGAESETTDDGDEVQTAEADTDDAAAAETGSGSGSGDTGSGGSGSGSDSGSGSGESSAESGSGGETDTASGETDTASAEDTGGGAETAESAGADGGGDQQAAGGVQTTRTESPQQGWLDMLVGVGTAAGGVVSGLFVGGLTSPGVLGLGALIIVALAGVVVVRRRRGQAESEEETEAPVFTETGTETEATETLAMEAATEEESETHADTESAEAAESALMEESFDLSAIEGEGGDETTASVGEEEEATEDDTIAEANVYLAYGLHQQAEDVLRLALKESPDRSDYQEKLLETLYGAGKRDEFLSEAKNYQGMVDTGSSRGWQRVVAMGREIAPDDELFSSAEAPDVQPEELQPAKPESADFELDEGSGEPALDFALDEGESTSEGGSDQGADDEFAETLMLDTGEFDAGDETEQADSGVEAEASEGESGGDEFEFDLGDIDELGGGEQSDSESAAESASDDDDFEFDLGDLDLEGGESESEGETAGSEGEAAASAASDEGESFNFDLEGLEEDSGEAAPGEAETSDAGSSGDSEEFDLSDLDFGEEESASGGGEESAGAEPSGAAESDEAFDLGDLDLGEEGTSGSEEAAGQSAESSAEGEFDLDALGELEGAPEGDAGDLDAEFLGGGEASTSDAAAGGHEEEAALDFDIPGLDTAGESQAEAASSGVESTPSAGASEGGGAADADVTSEEEEIDTMLDLAKAYIDMGDAESASNALQEVIESGNDTQRREAEKLLETVQ